MKFEDAAAATKTIQEVKEFGIDHVSKFKRFKVNIELSSSDANRLTKVKNPDFKEMTIFLKQLIEGEASLYVYKDGPIIKYFYETKTHPVEQLIHIRYLTENLDASENNLYRQQLFTNVKNEDTPEPEIRKLRFEERDLIAHFEKYNNESGKTAIFENRVSAKPFF